MSTINFLPERYLEQADRNRRRPINFMAIGMTAVALAGVWVLGDRSEALASRANHLEAQLHESEQERHEAAAIRAEIAGLQGRREIAREISQPVTTAQVLATIAQVTPEPIKLTNLEVIAHRPEPRAIPQPDAEANAQPPEADPTWLEITISGLAPGQDDVVELTRALSDHPLFTQVRPRSSGVATLRRYEAREFLIVLRVDLDREFVPTHTQGGETHAD